MPEEPQATLGDDPPPFGRTWRTLYATVLCTLAALIALFYAFTEAFR